MDEELKFSDECANNVANIQISEETKILLLCRARLSDIYENVSNVINHRYGKDTDDVIEGFWDAFVGFDDKLMKAISLYVDCISEESFYTKI